MANLRKESEDILADPMYGLCKDQIPNKTEAAAPAKLPAQWELLPPSWEILCQQRLLASARAAAQLRPKSQGKVSPRLRRGHHHILELLSYARDPNLGQLTHSGISHQPTTCTLRLLREF